LPRPSFGSLPPTASHKPTALHLPENTFALHFLFEDSKSLVDIVVTDKDLQLLHSLRFRSWPPVAVRFMTFAASVTL
jgi:hypothetical protein